MYYVMDICGVHVEEMAFFKTFEEAAEFAFKVRNDSPQLGWNEYLYIEADHSYGGRMFVGRVHWSNYWEPLKVKPRKHVPTPEEERRIIDDAIDADFGVEF